MNSVLCALRAVPERQGSEGDVGDLDLGVLLAVTLALLVTGLVLVLLDDDLGALGGAEDLDGHGRLAEGRGIGGDLLAVDGEHDGKRQRLADPGLHLVDLDDVAHGNLLLLGSCAHDRVHRGLLRSSGCSERLGLGRNARRRTETVRTKGAPRVNSTDPGDVRQNSGLPPGPWWL